MTSQATGSLLLTFDLLSIACSLLFRNVHDTRAALDFRRPRRMNSAIQPTATKQKEPGTLRMREVLLESPSLNVDSESFLLMLSICLSGVRLGGPRSRCCSSMDFRLVITLFLYAPSDFPMVGISMPIPTCPSNAPSTHCPALNNACRRTRAHIGFYRIAIISIRDRATHTLSRPNQNPWRRRLPSDPRGQKKRRAQRT